ncbi:MAG TPA: YkgJ family cysteine cluster protein [Allosphingosinicella sp.]|jgi:Fe-S-cluster containining protein
MSCASQAPAELRFACTACGACCNRSPEVQLSEAAGLADRFVFRLMFRLYEVPRSPAGDPVAPSPASFHESRRLLAAYAARSTPVRRRRGGKAVDHMRYLLISALTLDTGSGACSALEGGRCTLYGRRPLACRTLPFHYSRPEASARSDLEAFVAAPGHSCDTGAAAAVVLAGDRIVDPGALRARSDALELRERDGAWHEAILRRLKAGLDPSLPGLAEIEANSQFGATTASMRAGWRIAAEAGLIGPGPYDRLIRAQCEAIDRELASARCGAEARQTLIEMRSEYRRAPIESGY